MAERIGCHNDENGNDAMAAFRFRQFVEISVQKKCDGSMSCKDGGVIPVTGFPQDDGMTTRRNME